MIEGPRHGMTEEEVAEQLTIEEGRPVSVSEVRMVLSRALRKMRRILETERGLRLDDLLL